MNSNSVTCAPPQGRSAVPPKDGGGGGTKPRRRRRGRPSLRVHSGRGAAPLRHAQFAKLRFVFF
eukprot:4947976-Prymnesium_polylepis.3